MADNRNLYTSRADRTNEFYTQTATIEEELRHYKHFFEGKTVLCNCDDPHESNFFRYFVLGFNELRLGKLIATCYDGSPILGTEIDLFTPTSDKKAYKVEISEVRRKDVKAIVRDNATLLRGNGDFRSEECVELLREADVVVTNPPFSLMKEYLPMLISFHKHFLILGNMNHVTIKEIFRYFFEEKVWLGYNSGHFWFIVPDYYPEKKTDFKYNDDGKKMRRMGNICWFTNIDIEKRHYPLQLYESYSPEKYPKYDNYDAIEVSRYYEIPEDYYGVMGVPITYLAYHCPDQFDIIGIAKSSAGDPALKTKIYTRADYPNYNSLNAGPVLIQDGVPKVMYARILIRRKCNDNRSGRRADDNRII